MEFYSFEAFDNIEICYILLFGVIYIIMFAFPFLYNIIMALSLGKRTVT